MATLIAYHVTKTGEKKSITLQCPCCKNYLDRSYYPAEEIHSDRCGLCDCEFNYTINEVKDEDNEQK